MAHPVRDRRFPSLLTRLLSAAVLVPVTLAAVYYGMPWLGLLVGVVALLMAKEWAEICLARAQPIPWWPHPPIAAVALVSTVAMSLAVAAYGRFHLSLALSAVGVLIVVFLGMRFSREKGVFLGAGVAYIGLPVVAILWLHADPVFGQWTLYWLLGVVWVTDSGGYIAGKLIGGPKLAPVVSPNKTWAGFVGGLALATVLGAILAHAAGTGNVGPLIVASAALSLVAQGGDLLESAIKRHFDLKDSGTIIPGHGGLFDRVDGLLAAAPAVALVYLIAGGGGFLWR